MQKIKKYSGNDQSSNILKEKNVAAWTELDWMLTF